MRYLCLLSLLVAFVASPASSWAAACAKEEEKNALDMRALQTQLMVSALSCGEQKRYNQFMQKYKNDLSKSGENLTQYFSRVYASSAKSQQNNFVTKLANISSELSLKENEDAYCDDAEELFEDALDASPSEMDELAYEAGSTLHNIASCQ